jgi:hypothetical protein
MGRSILFDSDHIVFDRQLSRIVLLIALLGAIAAAVIRIDSTRTAITLLRPPSSLPLVTATSDSFRSGFLPLLDRAAAQADALVAMGDARERNLVSIHSAQDAMNAALQDADDWLASHPAPPSDETAVAAYRRGAAAVRAAMDEALAGFLHLDFGRVARATETMRQGAADLNRAIASLR